MISIRILDILRKKKEQTNQHNFFNTVWKNKPLTCWFNDPMNLLDLKPSHLSADFRAEPLCPQMWNLPSMHITKITTSIQVLFT